MLLVQVHLQALPNSFSALAPEWSLLLVRFVSIKQRQGGPIYFILQELMFLRPKCKKPHFHPKKKKKRKKNSREISSLLFATHVILLSHLHADVSANAEQ